MLRHTFNTLCLSILYSAFWMSSCMPQHALLHASTLSSFLLVCHDTRLCMPWHYQHCQILQLRMPWHAPLHATTLLILPIADFCAFHGMHFIMPRHAFDFLIPYSFWVIFFSFLFHCLNYHLQNKITHKSVQNDKNTNKIFKYKGLKIYLFSVLSIHPHLDFASPRVN